MPHISPITRADKILSGVVVCCMVAALVIVSFAAWWLRREPSPQGEMKSVTRNGRTATFLACPKCEMCARFASDARSATINLSRLRDGDPSPQEFARRREALLDRVFATLEEATRTTPFWCEAHDVSLVDAWRRRGVAYARVDDEWEVLMRDVGSSGVCVRDILVFNKTDLPRETVVEFAPFGLDGRVEVLDLTERAIPPDCTDRIFVVVPAHAVRVLRLKGEKK